eukprot:3984645-Prymnesium_polylepis.1
MASEALGARRRRVPGHRRGLQLRALRCELSGAWRPPISMQCPRRFSASPTFSSTSMAVRMAAEPVAGGQP